jgi:hypothetical protein
LRDQDHDGGRDWTDIESRIESSSKGERRDRQYKHEEQRDLTGVRHQDGDETSPKNPADGRDEIVHRRLQRSPGTDLRNNEGGQDCPKRQGNVETVSQPKRNQCRRRHSQRENSSAS